MDLLKDLAAVVAALGTFAVGIIGVLRYFNHRDKVLQTRDAFNAVVKSLSSDVEVERLAGAILLRRFFDSTTEVGTAGRPYWREAINVSVAILKGRETGNFQKLLADGLAFAPDLSRADLQKTNLQFAYFGPRPRQGHEEPKPTVLKEADFYRADLSNASLKNAIAPRAQFYQARMHGTILAGADLSGASLFEADLKGAVFNGALLAGANFHGALNVPEALRNRLDASVYTDTSRYEPPPLDESSGPIRVFISKPGCMSHEQSQCMAALLSRLETHGMVPQALDRPDYPEFAVFSEVQRIMNGCAGTVIFGFKELEIHDAVWRPGTSEEKQLREQWHSTPWSQIEAGMATMMGLPILVVFQAGVSGGVFDVTPDAHQLYRVRAEADWNAPAFENTFSAWHLDVRECARLATKP